MKLADSQCHSLPRPRWGHEFASLPGQSLDSLHSLHSLHSLDSLNTPRFGISRKTRGGSDPRSKAFSFSLHAEAQFPDVSQSLLTFHHVSWRFMYVQRLCVKPVSFLSCLCPLCRRFLLFLVAVALGHPRVIPAKPDPGEHFSLHSFSKKLSTLQTYSGYHEAGLWHLAPCDSQADTWACAWKAQDHAFLAGCSSWGLWCPLHLDALKSCGCSGLWVVSDRFISCLCEVMSLAGSFPSMASEVWSDPFRCLGVIRAGIARQRVLPVLCRLIWAMRSKKVWSRPVLRLSAIWPSQIVRAFDDAGVWGRKERGRASFRSVSFMQLFMSLSFNPQHQHLSKEVSLLVGGLEHFLLFHILGIITPTG